MNELLQGAEPMSAASKPVKRTGRSDLSVGASLVLGVVTAPFIMVAMLGVAMIVFVIIACMIAGTFLLIVPTLVHAVLRLSGRRGLGHYNPTDGYFYWYLNEKAFDKVR